ncbi:MAG TPA: lytic murein transglycosylase, partial [Oxalicibacterium sp.]|nr:lytic murein transglycosylase [Oxalicibacterium sp.]
MIFPLRPARPLSLAIALLISLSFLAVPSFAAKARKVQAQDEEFVNFAQWGEVNAFIDQMVAEHGFDKNQLQSILRQARYLNSAIQLVKPAPPGKPKNWNAYRNRFVEPIRIDAGVAFWNTYADTLARAENQYGVPAEIIVAILGVETIYGRNTGNFRVMDAITTLAFAYPDTPNREARMAYFRSELENTLLLARDENIDPFSLLGSYAGAVGLPQ